ncbi:MAG: flagellar FliJ protein [Gammaproteobacteria bacterium]|jgi:flagellar FliJ protein
MTRSEKFSPVLRIAESKKRDAARAAVKANKKLQEYENKLNELRSFRLEYSVDKNVVGQLVTTNKLQDRQNFIRQLDAGINIMEKKIEGQKQNSDLDKQAWLDAHKHVDAIDKLVGKIKKIETNMSELREDNELDDRSQHRKISN